MQNTGKIAAITRYGLASAPATRYSSGDYDDRRTEYAGQRCGCYGPRRLRRHIHSRLEAAIRVHVGASNAIDDGIRSIIPASIFSAAANLRLPRQKARSRHDYFHTDMDMHPAARVLFIRLRHKVACILCFSAIRRTRRFSASDHRKLPARYRYGKD